MKQRPPEFGGTLNDRPAVAAALGVEAGALSEDLPIQQVSCGAPFIMVPLSTREAVDRSQLDRRAMGELIDAAGLVRRGVMVFSVEDAERRCRRL